MQFNEIYIKKFKSYQSPVTINLKQGYNFIVGQNGSGKTNIVRAIQLVSKTFYNTTVSRENLDSDIEIEITIELSPLEQSFVGSIFLHILLNSLLKLRDQFLSNSLDSKIKILSSLLNELKEEELNNRFDFCISNKFFEFSKGNWTELNKPSKIKKLLELLQPIFYGSFTSYFKNQSKFERHLQIYELFSSSDQFFLQFFDKKIFNHVGEWFKLLKIKLIGDLTNLNTKLYFISNSNIFNF